MAAEIGENFPRVWKIPNQPSCVCVFFFFFFFAVVVVVVSLRMVSE